MPLIDREHRDDVVLIDRKLAKLEDDAECASFSKFTKLKDDTKYASLLKLIELVKISSNLTRIGKKKPHCPISHSLACFVEPIRRSCFYFTGGLADLTDGLAMGRVKLKEGEIAAGFSG